MAEHLTRQGAREFTVALDRVASVVQHRSALLGIPEKVALDFAKRCDLLSDAVELTAAANEPLTADDVTPESGGTTDDSPVSKDQNKPSTYGIKGAAVDETGTSVEPDGEGFDANLIGDAVPGPLEIVEPPVEAWMGGHFTQENFEQLRGKQQAADLPPGTGGPAGVLSTRLAFAIDKFNGTDPKGLVRLAVEMKRVLAADLGRLPGMAPMQLRGQIDRLAELRREIEMVSAQYEAVLKNIKNLEAEEANGLKLLKEAAAQLQEKGKYVVEAEKAMLQFEARVTTKVPGIEQMIASGEEFKPGLKAGDFFGRIAKELGAEVSASVERIYGQTKDDLSHMTTAIYGLKIVAKTASVDPVVLKKAGLADVVVSIKEWMSGKADAVAQRVFQFTGDIAKWVKGFVQRTKMVSSENDKLQKLLGDTLKDIDGVLAKGKTASLVEAADADNNWGFNLTK